MKRLVFVFGLCLLTATSAWAQTRYVSDQLQITLRSGPTNSHRIIKMMDAGVPVDILEAGDEGWVRVRTREGLEGWTLARHLMDTPSARDRLAVATTRLERTQQQLAELKQNLSSGNQQMATAQAQIQELTTANARMEKQLQDASRGLTLANENRDLKKEIVDMQREIEALQNESAQLRDRSRRDWFVTGALVVFGGFLAGIIVTRIRWQKKSSWSSL